MSYVCRILHYGPFGSANIAFSLLKKVTVICDKYDLAMALRGWSAAWLLKWHGAATSEEQLPQLLSMAAVFGDNDLFYSITSRLHRSCPISRLTIDDDLYALTGFSGRLFGELSVLLLLQFLIFLQAQLCVQRTMIRSGLQRIVEAGLCSLASPATISHHMQDLKDAGLWPTHTIMQEPSFQRVLNKLDGFKQSCHNMSGCQCGNHAFKSKISSIAIKTRGEGKGLCLGCARQGKFTAAEGNCQQTTCSVSDPAKS